MDWEFICNGQRPISYEKNAIVIQKGAVNQNLFYIKSGMISVESKGSDSITVLKPKQFFGELTVILLQTITYKESYISKTESEIYQINPENFYLLCQDRPEILARFYSEITKTLSSQKIRINSKITELNYDNIMNNSTLLHKLGNPERFFKKKNPDLGSIIQVYSCQWKKQYSEFQGNLYIFDNCIILSSVLFSKREKEIIFYTTINNLSITSSKNLEIIANFS